MPYLNRNQIIELINKRNIVSSKIINSLQLQPASLDLTLSNKCYRIKASFIPNEKPISNIISELLLAKIDLKDEFLLEKNCIYLCELNEKLRLPKNIKGKANPKSTTGRLDIFTRIITEYGTEYDFIDYNYKGKLFLEIIPQSFSIKIKKNTSLNQIRFYKKFDRDKLIYGVDVFYNEEKNGKIYELLKQPFQKYKKPSEVDN